MRKNDSADGQVPPRSVHEQLRRTAAGDGSATDCDPASTPAADSPDGAIEAAQPTLNRVEHYQDATAQHFTRRVSFEQLRLRVGTRFKLRRIDLHNDLSHDSRLYGYIKDESVLVSSPVIAGDALPLREGELIAARVAWETGWFSFTAAVVAVCATPGPYLHLAYPPYVEDVTARTKRRLPQKLVASINVPGRIEHQTGIRAEVTHLSAGGARLRSHRLLGELNSMISVACSLTADGNETTLSLQAVIRNATKQPDGRFVHRVQFVYLDSRDLKVLRGYMVKQSEGGS